MDAKFSSADDAMDANEKHLCRCFCDMDCPLPSVSSRLKNATPSRELVDHYRAKIEKSEMDFDEISSQIEACKNQFVEEFNMRRTISQKQEEICQLQKAVSDMQIHLYRERDHVFRLNAENDRLNLKQLEDKKIIEHLLGLVAIPEREVTIFLPSNTTKNLLPTDYLQGKCRNAEETMLKIQNDIMKSQVNSLQNQLDEQSRISKAEITALIEDRRIRNEEFESSRKMNLKTFNDLTDKLRNVEMKLADNLGDTLRARKRCRVTLQDAQSPIRNVKTRLSNNKTAYTNQHKPMENEKKICSEPNDICQLSCKHLSIIKDLKEQLKHTQDLLQMKQLEKAGTENMAPLAFRMDINPQMTRKRGLSDARSDAGKMQREDRDADSKAMTSLQEQLSLYKKRYKDLERRRRLEVEGFRNDIKFLKENLGKVEEMLFKVTLSLENDDEAAILSVVKQTAGRSKKIAADLNVLKNKMWILENEARFL